MSSRRVNIVCQVYCVCQKSRSKAFSEMVETPERRLKFTLSTMEFLRQYNFDGLDIDWEYPTLRQGKMEDKPRFAMLIKVNIFIMMNSNYLLL
jgi:GH18 family chitinase